MAVVWDPRKAGSNFRKHGVRFSDAEGVLFDPGALTRDDPTSQGEHRFVSVGMASTGELLVVVHTYRGDDFPPDLGAKGDSSREAAV